MAKSLFRVFARNEVTKQSAFISVSWQFRDCFASLAMTDFASASTIIIEHGADRMLMSKSEDELPVGRYRHYKGNFYEVIGTARHSETEEVMVVYRCLYGDGSLWVRPLASITCLHYRRNCSKIKLGFS